MITGATSGMDIRIIFIFDPTGVSGESPLQRKGECRSFVHLSPRPDSSAVPSGDGLDENTERFIRDFPSGAKRMS